MTDQPKPDKKPESDAVESPAVGESSSAQVKDENAQSKPEDSSSNANSGLGTAPLSPPAEEAKSKPSDGNETKSADNKPEMAAKPVPDNAPKAVTPTTTSDAKSTDDKPKPTTEPIPGNNIKPAAAESTESKAPGAGQTTRNLNDPNLLKDILPSRSIEAKPGEPKATQRLPDVKSLSKSSEPAPSSAAQICPTCGHRNRPGVLLCDNCGTNLMTGRKTALGTRDLKKEQEAKAEAQEKLLDTSQTLAVETAGGSTFTESMVLRIEIEGGSTPMLVYPKQEIIMGRRDPNTGGMPDVDLTAYAGYRMGVSRHHAAIRLQEEHLHVSDLGSSNGTFLNGTRLNAHRPYQLRDGDEVRLGQMVLKVFFQSNKDHK